MPTIQEFVESIITNLSAIEDFSFTDVAETVRVLREVDNELDTLRSYLEGERMKTNE